MSVHTEAPAVLEEFVKRDRGRAQDVLGLTPNRNNRHGTAASLGGGLRVPQVFVRFNRCLHVVVTPLEVRP